MAPNRSNASILNTHVAQQISSNFSFSILEGARTLHHGQPGSRHAYVSHAWFARVDEQPTLLGVDAQQSECETRPVHYLCNKVLLVMRDCPRSGGKEDTQVDILANFELCANENGRARLYEYGISSSNFLLPYIS